jgi:hypothetical protein
MTWDSECLKKSTAHDRKNCRKKIQVATRMYWFRNIKSPDVFLGPNSNEKSGDYSLQLQMGFANYKAWEIEQKGKASPLYLKKVKTPGTDEYKEAAYVEAKRQPHRAVGLEEEPRKH